MQKIWYLLSFKCVQHMFVLGSTFVQHKFFSGSKAATRNYAKYSLSPTQTYVTSIESQISSTFGGQKYWFGQFQQKKCQKYLKLLNFQDSIHNSQYLYLVYRQSPSSIPRTCLSLTLQFNCGQLSSLLLLPQGQYKKCCIL